ncbi:MAG: TolC family protein [Candidatus Calescibacterium sp.]|nr:TolC family protein [Candidatus Calescibacterium sp.]MDW8195152.1 TolC family protein [Candidatus Calescibacterium sp.]
MKTVRKKFSFFILFLFISFDLSWSIDSIIQNLPEVKKAENEIYSAYYDLKLTYSQFGVNIDSFYRYSYNQPTVSVNLGPAQLRVSQDFTYNYGLNLNWIIKTFGLLENQITSKEIIYISKVLKYQQTISDMYFRFYQLFYEMLKAYILLDFSNRSIAYSKELLYNTKKLYDVGVVAKVDYLRALSTYQEFLAQNKSAYQNYILATQNIYSFLVTKDNTGLDKLFRKYTEYLDSDFVYDLPENRKSPEELRVSKILYSNIISLIHQKKATASQNFPILSLNSLYLRQKSATFSREYNFNITLSLSWKIFDSNLSKNQQEIIKHQIYSLYEEYKRNIINLMNMQSQIRLKHQIDYSMYSSLLYNLDYRKEAFRLIKLKYENGLATYLDYLDSQNNLLQTQLNIKNYKNELFMNYVTYLYLNDLDLSTKEVIEKKLMHNLKKEE